MRGRKSSLNFTKSLGQYTTTVNGKLHRLGADREQAEQQYRWLMNKHDRGEPVAKNPSFSQIADAWLEYVKENHDPERYRLSRDRMEEFVAWVGVQLKVKDLRPRHVEEWIESKKQPTSWANGRYRAGVTKNGTIRGYKSIILACLNWAASKKARLVPSNPLKGLLELPEGDSRGGDAVWPDDLIQTVLRVSNPAFADVVRILAWTGARPSTICRVEAKHYLPHLKLWDVEDLYRSRKTRIKYVKRIWLPPDAVRLVERLNKQHPEGPIFRNSHGTPWNSDALGVYLFQLRHKFKETKTLPWPKTLCVYGLRHTFATRFIREHPDKLEYLRELLGHTSLDMIRKHYGHLFDEHDAIHGVLSTLSLPGSQSAPVKVRPAAAASGTGA